MTVPTSSSALLRIRFIWTNKNPLTNWGLPLVHHHLPGRQQNILQVFIFLLYFLFTHIIIWYWTKGKIQSFLDQAPRIRTSASLHYFMVEWGNLQHFCFHLRRVVSQLFELHNLKWWSQYYQNFRSIQFYGRINIVLTCTTQLPPIP